MSISTCAARNARPFHVNGDRAAFTFAFRLSDSSGVRNADAVVAAVLALWHHGRG